MKALLQRTAALLIAALFLFPFVWMFACSFRSQEAILTDPLRLIPESFDVSAYTALASIAGQPLSIYFLNSLFITAAATALGVVCTTLGAYALYRKPRLPLFGFVHFGFLTTMMYPGILLVIPAYIVVYHLGLLGTYAGIILYLSLLPVLYLLLSEFFRSIPRELIEVAKVDGATEMQTFWHVVLPLMRPILYTSIMIGFLLNWKQWVPVTVIASGAKQHTLPVALLALNSEFGVSFQSTMALSTITTIPVVILFALTQRAVVSGLMAGAVKG